ncbi:hypothetical protein PG994_006964 [Apiospora phragmitis]|uniref:Uncharacterized protein n=1 Tax=Apiospora phragmitis TaxID=2905665 RepID=A0ABR1VGH1_9PEZI
MGVETAFREIPVEFYVTSREHYRIILLLSDDSYGVIQERKPIESPGAFADGLLSSPHAKPSMHWRHRHLRNRMALILGRRRHRPTASTRSRTSMLKTVAEPSANLRPPLQEGLLCHGGHRESR